MQKQILKGDLFIGETNPRKDYALVRTCNLNWGYKVHFSVWKMNLNSKGEEKEKEEWKHIGMTTRLNIDPYQHYNKAQVM